MLRTLQKECGINSLTEINLKNGSCVNIKSKSAQSTMSYLK
jgi:hypothetical protein